MKKITVRTRDEWRKWLGKNYDTETEIWLVFYKKHTGKESIPYDDSVEEAICFGWIDSLVKRIDDDRYARKFTRRINKHQWSPSNLKRAGKMITEGRMTEAGLKVFDPREDTKQTQVKRSIPTDPPAIIERAFRKVPGVWESFNRLAPSHRRNYIGWIMSARKEETRQKRIEESIAYLSKDHHLPLK